MRCATCNKFTSFEEQEPEVAEPEVSDDGTATVAVRIANACEGCSEELTEWNFDAEADHAAEVAAHRKDCKDGELSIELGDAERTNPDLNVKPMVKCKACRGHNPKCKVCAGKGEVPKPILARFRKTFYGFQLPYTIKCSCEDLTIEGVFADAIQASGMESVQ